MSQLVQDAPIDGRRQSSGSGPVGRTPGAKDRAGPRALLRSVLRGEGEQGQRLSRIRAFSKDVRTSEYHLTNACNLRCHGCWFFKFDYDSGSRELNSIEAWRMFAKEQAEQHGITSALLIGGEPTLYPERVRAFTDQMPYVTISSNGLRKLPVDGFENVAIALTVFGGTGGADDELRAIRPNGSRFEGLLDTVLGHYRNDRRASFIFGCSPDHLDAIEPTVQRIEDNGNVLAFNYYSEYGSADPLRRSAEDRLLTEVLRAKDRHPETVISTEYTLRTLITGRTEWASFGYDVCPSISVANPVHEERLKNGHPVLPSFNSYAADAKTLNFCCASGSCDGCRDSQAIYSWLLVNMKHFLESEQRLEIWLDTVESYWSQFCWAPFHRSHSHGSATS